MSADILDTIKEQIESNPILLYMKGTPAAPQCGFSAQTVRCLMACGQRFAYVDILAHPEIRATLPGYASVLAGIRFRSFLDGGEPRWIRVIEALALRSERDPGSRASRRPAGPS